MTLNDSGFEERVRAEKVESLARNLRAANILGALVAALMAESVAPKVHQDARLWLYAYLLVTLCRGITSELYRHRVRTASDVSANGMVRWEYIFTGWLLVGGALWGIFGFMTFDLTDTTHTLFIETVQIGLVAQALATMSIYTPAMYCFCLPAMFGFIVPRMLTGNNDQMTICAMAVIFLLLIFYSGHNSERKFAESMRLRYSNQQLIKDLRDSNEKAEAASRAKTEFLAVMSHEIRTPMNGIGAMAELLSGTTLNDEQRGMMTIIRRSASGLLSILGDILDYSKIEAGRLSLELTSLDLRNLAEDVMQILALTAEEKGLEMVLDVAPDLPTEVRGDPARLRQILFNLLNNAVKFTETGHVLLRIKRRADELSFWVSDTGPGIPQEVRSKLFLPFMQADSSVARRFGGTGLGLSICKRLVELMDGNISLSSTPGMGTTVQFSIPYVTDPKAQPATLLRGVVVSVQARFPSKEAIVHLLQAQGAEVTDDAEQADLVVWEETPPRVGKPAVELISFRHHMRDWTARDVVRKPARTRDLVAAILGQLGRPLTDAAPFASPFAISGAIQPHAGDAPAREVAEIQNAMVLVVEDHPINRLVIVKLLDRLGLLYDLAEDGVEALEYIARNSYYGLILTDLHMPRLDGFALVEALRQRHLNEKDTHPVPIVALTADAMPETLNRCKEAGFDGYLTKPLSLVGLQETIARWLPPASSPPTMAPPTMPPPMITPMILDEDAVRSLSE